MSDKYEYKNGYRVKISKKIAAHSHKTPFFCPHCSKITCTFDDNYLLEHGVCGECYTMYIDLREEPLIDLDKYKPKK